MLNARASEEGPGNTTLDFQIVLASKFATSACRGKPARPAARCTGVGATAGPPASDFVSTFLMSDNALPHLRLGLIGCGWFSQRAHIPALLKLEKGSRCAPIKFLVFNFATDAYTVSSGDFQSRLRQYAVARMPPWTPQNNSCIAQVKPFRKLDTDQFEQ